MISLDPCRSSGFVVMLFFVQFSSPVLAFTQRYVTTLGAISELRAGRDARGIFSGDFNGDGLADVATYGDTQVLFQFREASGGGWKSVPFHVDNRILHAISGRCNSDRLSDLILLADHPPEVQVYLGKSRNRFYPSAKIPVNGSYDELYCADINSDGWNDLILCGKKELGICVLLGKGNGNFAPDSVILGEYSVNNLEVVDINSDGLSDLITSNWISNELFVYTAFGKMRFAEPSIVHLPSESSWFATAHIDSDETTDLIVVPAGDHDCLTFAGDGLGEFQLHESITLDDSHVTCGVADLNGDSYPDVCILSAKGHGLSVYVDGAEGRSHARTIFGAGVKPTGFTFIKDTKSERTSVAILDEGSFTIRLLWNAGLSFPHALESNYVTAVSPGSVEVADVNMDGREDILVANRGSQCYSLYMNEGGGSFSGQISVETPGTPAGVRYLRKDDSTAFFIATKEDGAELSVTEFHTSNISSRSVAIPTQGSSELVEAWLDPTTTGLRLISLERKQESRFASLIGYEEIGSLRFVEHGILPATESSIITAMTGDVNGDSISDLFYVAYDASSRKEQLFGAAGRSSGIFDTARAGISFENVDTLDALLWLADLNNDAVSDLIINLRAPENAILISLGHRDSMFNQVTYRFKNSISIASISRLTVSDLNGDGKKDIVLLNDQKNEIQYFQGKGEGTFWPAVRVASADHVGGFALSRLTSDDSPQLILTDEAKSILKIITLEER